MKLLREVNEVVAPEDDIVVGPYVPDGWSVGLLANHGILLACDGFSVKFDGDNLDKFFDIVEDGQPGEVKDHDGKVVLVEPSDDGIVLARHGDKVYPEGVLIGLAELKHLGIEHFEQEHESDPEEDGDQDTEEVTIDEGVKTAYRRAGKKIKRGFRVTSGFRKGRVVATAAGATKPRAKASTRAKLRLARKKKKVIRILKSKRTRKKSLSKRLARMNSLRK